jgi:isopenicillin-N N-acyltransferase-like protein
MTLRILELQGRSPTARGEQHGETFKNEIHGIYDVRLRLMLQKTDLSTEENVLALARHHLPVLERFDPGLATELDAIARAAGLTPAHLVVVNHYTDLRDLSLRDLRALGTSPAAADPGGCSAWFVDGEHRLLGQTWDMHASATPYALLLIVTNDDGSKTALFTITGCLGMTGMTSTGVALTINNLNSLDATVGVIWPALVRKALAQPTAASSLALLQAAPIGSGRHYVVADGRDVFGMETSGTRKKVIFEGQGPGASKNGASYFHTNHCVDDEMKATARIMPGSTTLLRYQTLQARADGGRVPRTAREMFDAFADVGLSNDKPDAPDDVATCGAIVMDLKQKTALACQGIPGPGVTPFEVIL